MELGNADSREVGESIQGIQSIEIGGRILFTLCDARSPVALTTLAKKVDMHPSAVRRYLVSFSRVGLVRQNHDGHYDIGPRALDLGLNFLGRLDFVNEAAPIAQALRDKVGESVGLVMWIDGQATMIRFDEAPKHIITKIRVGSTMPLLASATGHLFAAFLPEDLATATARAELKAGSRPMEPATVTSMGEFRALRKYIAARRFAIYRESVHSNSVAIAAPVFDAENQMIAAIAVIGQIGILDDQDEGPMVDAIREAATEISRCLGWRA